MVVASQRVNEDDENIKNLSLKSCVLTTTTVNPGGVDFGQKRLLEELSSIVINI